jgi:hypothetical protein
MTTSRWSKKRRNRASKGHYKMQKADYLIGKYFLADHGTTYSTGEILAAVGDHFYVVKFDDMSEKKPMLHTNLVCLHEMASTIGDEDNEIKSWMFFDPRQDLKNHLSWMETPAKSEVVKLVGKAH